MQKLDRLFRSDLGDRPADIDLWVLLDLVFYLMHIWLDKRASIFEIVTLGALDVFLYLTKDDRDKLKVFHSLPRIFLLHLKNNPILTILNLLTIGLHSWMHIRSNKSVVFFLAITLSIYCSSLGITKIIALSFVTGIMASYMYLWETIEPVPQRDEETLKFEQLSNNDDLFIKDQAIAQDLVSKLKRLKVAMIMEKERIRKTQMLRRDLDKNKVKRNRSRSVADKEDKDNSDKDENQEVIRNVLSLEDLKQLIEILVSHNSQEMKYWLPKDILSVLNNEEVSAYLWAYINTQDMIPSPRAVKNIIASNKQESIKLQTGNSIGEDFNFDFFDFAKNNIHKDSLLIACSQIYKKFGTLEHLNNIPEQTMNSFLDSVQSFYFSNFYHNSIHAIDVTNSCAFFLNCGLKSVFTNLEVVTMLISATVHDVGHPGFNNAFMMEVGTSQALIYNDQSVLENYHCSLTFQIIQKEKNNILKNLTRENHNSFRKLLINNVLATDLSKHFMIIKKFASSIETDELNLTKEDSKHMVQDVGHSAKSLELHKIWSRRVAEEFWNQGDHEIELGIPVTQLCDRKNNLAKSQDGFLAFMAIPLYDGFGKFLEKFTPKECYGKYSEVCMAQIKNNKAYWLSLIEKGDSGNDEFMQETEAHVRNIKLSPLPLDSLLNFPEYLQNE